MPYNDHRFTIYDAMEAKGVFSTNSANAGSYDPVNRTSLYTGPVEYPMMLYHPKGKTRITVPAEVVLTPYGPERHSEQKEILWELVNNAEEHKKLLEAGWHEHPADSIAAGLTDEQKADGVKAPAKSSDARIKALEKELARSQAELARAKAAAGDEVETKPAAISAKKPN